MIVLIRIVMVDFGVEFCNLFDIFVCFLSGGFIFFLWFCGRDFVMEVFVEKRIYVYGRMVICLVCFKFYIRGERRFLTFLLGFIKRLDYWAVRFFLWEF